MLGPVTSVSAGATIRSTPVPSSCQANCRSDPLEIDSVSAMAMTSAWEATTASRADPGSASTGIDRPSTSNPETVSVVHTPMTTSPLPSDSNRRMRSWLAAIAPTTSTRLVNRPWRRIRYSQRRNAYLPASVRAVASGMATATNPRATSILKRKPSRATTIRNRTAASKTRRNSSVPHP